MLRVIGLLLLIPLFDILVLVALATRIGAVATVALVVLTALLGLLLVRAEGRHTLRKIQEKLQRGEIPEDEVVDGGLLIAAGAFLLTPGIVTDLVGLLLALPPTRYPVRLAVKKFVVTPYVDSKTGGIYTGGVYTAGFPEDDPDGDYDTYDMGDDEYSVDRGSGSDN
ncbi:FxsA family protein [Halomarina halobia]|uniref:FxsA family protein n=1 Tax=Halomarina halobia TaxID=3033386 RepID=A0ABD6A8I5_9EURY|nr:FxsA family protein [Halomarina sp. PSR21]